MGLDGQYGDMVTAPSVGIIGAGPAGLIAAETLARSGAAVTVYERMPSVARKLLMAGRGGLNLTHSEPLETFLTRYTGADDSVTAAIRAWPPARLVAWSEDLGQQTFVGTSGRIFPKALKASPLVRAWLIRLASLHVTIETGYAWQGWTEAGDLDFSTASGSATRRHDATLLAVGGGSWPRLGSDGRWTARLAERGVPIVPLQPSNCGVRVTWSAPMAKFAGHPLKRIALTTGTSSVRGEAVITAQGIEGGAVYAVGPELRRHLSAAGTSTAFIDLRPDEREDALAARLAKPRGKQSTATYLRKTLQLPPAAIALLHEEQDGKLPVEPLALARLIKAVPVRISGLSGLDRAISTAGGLPLSALDGNCMIKTLPGVFAAGEMLDWDAPTGGYLLQACFATGASAAAGIMRYLDRQGVRAEHIAAGP